MIINSLSGERRTITARLEDLANNIPDKTAITFLLDEGREESMSYLMLTQRAMRVGSMLSMTHKPGARVLLLLPPGLEFIIGFLGCVWAGLIAVPAYPPRLRRNSTILAGIALDAGVSTVVCKQDISEDVLNFIDSNAQLREISCVHFENIDVFVDGPVGSFAAEDDLAYLQYTSGSTGNPKGVMISHGNVISNCDQISKATGLGKDSIFVSWLPHYHDMGLIGGILQPITLGARTILLPPAMVVQQPMRWLGAIDRFRATASGGPNFIFEQCVEFARNRDIGELDLSCWRIACVGAEPVRAATLNRFTDAFSKYGFRSAAFYPAYGLAEATVMVTGESIESIGEFAGGRGNSAEFIEDGRPIDCGTSLDSETVSIVEPVRRELCPDGVEGEIWVSGPNVAKGYWGRPKETKETFQAQLSAASDLNYLKTGDMGFVQKGRLFITGRIKDLIIIRGRNIHPEDVEETVTESHIDLAPGLGAVFAVPGDGVDRLVVVHEIRRRSSINLAEVADKIRRDIIFSHDVDVFSIIILRPGSIPRGTSGKVQRHLCRQAFLNDTLRSLGDFRHAEAVFPEFPSDTDGFDQPRRVGKGFSRDEISKGLIGEIERVAKVRSGSVLESSFISDVGLDSIGVLRVKNYIENVFEINLKSDLFFSCVSIRDLVSVMQQEILIRKIVDGDLEVDTVSDLISELSEVDLDSIISIVDRGVSY